MNGRAAIVLAAGEGRRFGGGKLLADWRGRPLAVAAAESALGARVDEVRIVLGGDGEAVRAALETALPGRLLYVESPDWREGQSASLRAGLASLSVGMDRVALFLADMPLTPAGLADALMDAVSGDRPAARPVGPAGPGHPVALHLSLRNQLMALRGDRGAGPLLAGMKDRLIELPTDDPGATYDIDRPDDLEKA